MVKSYKLNPDSSVPLYKQIVKIIESEIGQGELKAGERMPSESELTEIFGVSRITVRAAIDKLQDTGMVKRSRGKGTFVNAEIGFQTHSREKGTIVTSEMAKYSEENRVGFTHSCALAGKMATTELLNISWMYPNVSDIEFLKVDEDELVLSTKRLRFVDSVPTIIETNHYTKEFAFLEKEDLSGSLYEILIKHGIKMGKSIRTLEVCYADQQEAMELGVKKGDALLLFTDMLKSQEEKPLYISRQVYCTERLKFYL